MHSLIYLTRLNVISCACTQCSRGHARQQGGQRRHGRPTDWTFLLKKGYRMGLYRGVLAGKIQRKKLSVPRVAQSGRGSCYPGGIRNKQVSMCFQSVTSSMTSRRLESLDARVVQKGLPEKVDLVKERCGKVPAQEHKEVTFPEEVRAGAELCDSIHLGLLPLQRWRSGRALNELKPSETLTIMALTASKQGHPTLKWKTASEVTAVPSVRTKTMATRQA
ncbi:hypothetical protein H920_15592 [Fukomys damarensis]|uniref:Uncharacterized protein n=1 Tax=Fukomys damarensis TaxID=885580 RepID=A0A091CU49_FUKDA|nr:hypothetical protein H920_15592 [Fukomys damarensis]